MVVMVSSEICWFVIVSAAIKCTLIVVFLAMKYA